MIFVQRAAATRGGEDGEGKEVIKHIERRVHA